MASRAPLLIRADATPEMGCGHIIRCKALADAAKNIGLPVIFGGRCEVDWLKKLLANEGYIFLPSSFSLRGDSANAFNALQYMAEIKEAVLKECAVVVDGYHFLTDHQKMIRQNCAFLTVIDDYCHLPAYNCDLLVNPNPASEIYKYQGQITKMLRGLQFALLRPEFKNIQPKLQESSQILISLGGGNFITFLDMLVKALPIEIFNKKSVTVIAGSMSEKEITKLFSHFNCNLKILTIVENMRNLLANMDAAITAGGSTCWELCAAGVPFNTIEVAENQKMICDWLHSNDYAHRFSCNRFSKLLSDNNFRNIQSKKIYSLVDGNGADRVIKNIIGMEMA